MPPIRLILNLFYTDSSKCNISLHLNVSVLIDSKNNGSLNLTSEAILISEDRYL